MASPHVKTSDLNDLKLVSVYVDVDIPRLAYAKKGNEPDDSEILAEMVKACEKRNESEFKLGALTAALYVNQAWMAEYILPKLQNFKQYLEFKVRLEAGMADKLIRCMWVHLEIVNRFPDDREIPKLLARCGMVKPGRILDLFRDRPKEQVYQLLRLCYDYPASVLRKEAKQYLGLAINNDRTRRYEKAEENEAVILQALASTDRFSMLVGDRMAVPRTEPTHIWQEVAANLLIEAICKDQDKTPDQVFFAALKALAREQRPELIRQVRVRFDNWVDLNQSKIRDQDATFPYDQLVTEDA